jgi:hypothetical protein
MERPSLYEFAGGSEAIGKLAAAHHQEWAVCEVHACSPRDSVVPRGEPMPHWSWDGLQGQRP